MDFEAQSVSTLSFEAGYIVTRLACFKGNVYVVESANGVVGVIEKLIPGDSGMFVDCKGDRL